MNYHLHVTFIPEVGFTSNTAEAALFALDEQTAPVEVIPLPKSVVQVYNNSPELQ